MSRFVNFLKNRNITQNEFSYQKMLDKTARVVAIKLIKELNLDASLLNYMVTKHPGIGNILSRLKALQSKKNVPPEVKARVKETYNYLQAMAGAHELLQKFAKADEKLCNYLCQNKNNLYTLLLNSQTPQERKEKLDKVLIKILGKYMSDDYLIKKLEGIATLLQKP